MLCVDVDSDVSFCKTAAVDWRVISFGYARCSHLFKAPIFFFLLGVGGAIFAGHF